MSKRVLVIADQDLDGTGSAVIITKYYEMFFGPKFPFRKGAKVNVLFPARSELNDLFASLDWCKGVMKDYDEIYLCDTAPNSPEACANIGEVLAPKLTIFDHHATNLKRLETYRQNFKSFNIIEGDRCSAKIAFDCLRQDVSWSFMYATSLFATLVNDLDMWYRKFPRSTELADYVSVVGPDKAYPILLEICTEPDVNVEDMEIILAAVKKQKEQSLELAKATLVKHEGYRKPFYSCLVDDWSSWVAGELVPKSGLIAMFDIRKKSLSFRTGAAYVGNKWHKAKDPKPNCLDFAEILGGGGHPQAAGVSPNEAASVFKQLSKRFGELLLEKYNERSRSTTKRKVNRTNPRSRKQRVVRSGVRRRSS